MSFSAQHLHTTITKFLDLKYLLYVPPTYEATAAKFPLILYLHGRGERGTDLELVKKHGLAKRLEQGAHFPFVIMAPQCPPDSDWSLHLEELTGLLDEILATYRIDAQRLYLTGLSMGGRATWALALKNPHRFAALAPICARRPDVLRGIEKVAALKHLPAWLFHGALDEVVPLEESEVMAKALREYGAEIKLTIYPEAKHDSWTQAYNTPELYEWFLTHVRSTP